MVAYLSIWASFSSILGIYLVVWWILGFSEFSYELQKEALDKKVLLSRDFVHLILPKDIEVAVGVFAVGNLLFFALFSFLKGVSNGFDWLFVIVGASFAIGAIGILTRKLVRLAFALKTLKVCLQVETEK